MSNLTFLSASMWRGFAMLCSRNFNLVSCCFCCSFYQRKLFLDQFLFEMKQWLMFIAKIARPASLGIFSETFCHFSFVPSLPPQFECNHSCDNHFNKPQASKIIYVGSLLNPPKFACNNEKEASLPDPLHFHFASTIQLVDCKKVNRVKLKFIW